MFSYIKGTLEEYWEDTIVVESGGIGWNIHVPLSVLDRLPHVGEQIKVYTSFQVKEDSMTLYGFFSRQDLKMFNQLLGVTGIGPKAALGILSSLSPDDLRMAIIAEDSKAIAKAPGIGPKTAKRVILDLKDKISMDEVLPLQFTAARRRRQLRQQLPAWMAQAKRPSKHWLPWAIPQQKPQRRCGR